MKNRLWSIIFLLIVWCGLNNSVKPAGIAFGLVIATFVSFIVLPKKIKFHVRLIKIIIPVIYIISELIKASVQVAKYVIMPSKQTKSDIIKVPIVCNHPVQITLLANCISLTPGTLVVDLEKDNSILVVHIMFAENKKQVLEFIKLYLEPMIMDVIKND